MPIRLTPGRGVRAERARFGGVPVLILRPRHRAPSCGLLWIHGGGYATGMKEMVYMGRAPALAEKFGALVVSPGYRLSWQRPYPAAVQDCYAALFHMHNHAAELGIPRGRLMVGGESAGGGLAAAVCMMARDRALPVAYQFPLYPMLDNFDTDSSRDNHGKIWNTRRNHMGWRLYLRKAVKTAVPPYAAPARQTNYCGLPPCYTFVGDGEPFHDETLQYVAKLRAAGVEAAVDVYHTDVHAFDMLYPEKDVSRAAISAFERQFEKALNQLEQENEI